MHLLVEGLNYRGAPLHVRERVFLGGEGLRQWLRRLSGSRALSGGAILSTCNRTEFYVSADDPVAAGAELGALTRQLDPDGGWQTFAYRLRDAQALEHLFRVPAGMDSVILGEGQIMGQFKDALRQAQEAGAVDARLDFYMRRAISVAKRVRTETAIGRNPIGYGHVAVRQAEEIFGDLRGRTAMLVGAGKMSGTVARQLAAAGIAQIYFSNRTPEHAVALAATIPSNVLTSMVESADVEAVAARADVLVYSSSAPGYLLTREAVEDVMRARRRRPLFILDLAMPRDVEPGVAEVDDAYLYNLDDLADIIRRSMRERGAEVPAAQAIVDLELERTATEIVARGAAARVKVLVDEAEAARREVLARYGPADLTPAQADALERLSRALVARVLHGPIARLRAGIGEEEAL